ncbi:MAG: hypothetical protein ACXW20_16090, partial [Burkholderiales bacterium]
LASTGLAEARTCAGRGVYLVPAVAYAEQGMRQLQVVTRSTIDLAAGPSRPYWREATCDAQGKFVFTGVPAGTWWVVTELTYEVAALSPADPWVLGTEKQIGVVRRKVMLRRCSNEVTLTHEHAVLY